MNPYKSFSPLYLLCFGHEKLPDGIDNTIENGSPHPEIISMARYLSSATPMICLAFSTKDNSPPTISQLYSVVQKGYSDTSEEPELHDSYGLLLDALKMISQTTPNGLMRTGEYVEDIEGVDVMDALAVGSIMHLGTDLCCVRFVQTTHFTV